MSKTLTNSTEGKAWALTNPPLQFMKFAEATQLEYTMESLYELYSEQYTIEELRLIQFLWKLKS